MEHIGIDVGSRDSQVCIRGERGEIIEEARWRTNELEALMTRRVPARVVLETCTEAFRLGSVARRHGHDVRILAATLVAGAVVRRWQAWFEKRCSGCSDSHRGVLPDRSPV